METNKLIQSLAIGADPVRRLPQPHIRAATWLAIALPYVALVVLVVEPRVDLVAKLGETRFLLEQFAALATGVAAAIAAFSTTIPGYSRKVILLPAALLALWLGTLTQGCLQELLSLGWGGIKFHPDLYCFPAIALVGAIPAIAMAFMLRRGAPMTPFVSVALGGLAAGALGNFGLRLFHPEDASLMILIWQFGSVAVLTALAGLTGRFLLNWDSIAPRRVDFG